jgi:hypothetical protein
LSVRKVADYPEPEERVESVQQVGACRPLAIAAVSFSTVLTHSAWWTITASNFLANLREAENAASEPAMASRPIFPRFHWPVTGIASPVDGTA